MGDDDECHSESGLLYFALWWCCELRIHCNLIAVFISESHILEDVNRCVMALHQQDPEMLDITANSVKGRSARICVVVNSEMLNYEPGLYTDKVKEAVAILKTEGNCVYERCDQNVTFFSDCILVLYMPYI